MVVVIDTCSLLAMTKYYLPFDDNQVLYHFIESGFQNVDPLFNEQPFPSHRRRTDRNDETMVQQLLLCEGI